MYPQKHVNPPPVNNQFQPPSRNSGSSNRVILSQIPHGVTVPELTHCVPPHGLIRLTAENGTAVAHYRTPEDADFAVNYFFLCSAIRSTSSNLLNLRLSGKSPTSPVFPHKSGIGFNNSSDAPNSVDFEPSSRLLYYSKVLRLCDQLDQCMTLRATKDTSGVVEPRTNAEYNSFSRSEYSSRGGTLPEYSANDSSTGPERVKTLYIYPRDGEKSIKFSESIFTEQYFSQFDGFELMRCHYQACFVRFKDRESAEACLQKMTNDQTISPYVTVSFANSDSRSVKDVARNEDFLARYL